MSLCECGCGLEAKQGNRYIHGHHVRRRSSPMKNPEVVKKCQITRKINQEIKKGLRPAPEPKYCACGCGQLVKENMRYINGHIWKGKYRSETSKQKMSAKAKLRTGDKNPNFGNHPTAWNKNLTKETDPRVKKYGESHKGKHHPPETGQKISKNKERNRKISEKLKGENNPMWQGGISFGKYCFKFNFKFKERVRIFFGRVCINCGKTEQEDGRRMGVHHVNYDKMMCCNDTKPLFVTLCRKCNAIVNKNRTYWEEYFTNIIMKDYGGQCYLPKEIKEE